MLFQLNSYHVNSIQYICSDTSQCDIVNLIHSGYKQNALTVNRTMNYSVVNI